MTVDQVTATSSKHSRSTSQHSQNLQVRAVLLAADTEHISHLSHNGSVTVKKEIQIFKSKQWKDF